MPNAIRVRDVVRNATYDLRPDETVLLVPYELFRPVGAVRKRGALVDWVEGNVIHSGRFVSSSLEKAEVGVRVLVRLAPAASADDEWWLCEVERVDDVAGNLSESSHDRRGKNEAP
jgi:hypothetical protein